MAGTAPARRLRALVQKVVSEVVSCWWHMARSTSRRRQGFTCPRCGARCAATAKFCAQCGGPLASVSLPVRRSRRWGRRLVVGAIGLLVVAIIIGNLTDTTDSDEPPTTTEAGIAAATTPTSRVSSTSNATVTDTSVRTDTATSAATATITAEATGPTVTVEETALTVVQSTRTSEGAPKETLAPTTATATATTMPTETPEPSATALPPTETPTPGPTATPAPPSGVPGRARAAQVIEAIDGDTFLVLYNGEEQRVELIGVDAPELEAEFGVECLAENAHDRLDQLLTPGKWIWLEGDDVNRNEAGSFVRYVWVTFDSGRVTLVNEDLLARGLAAHSADPVNPRRNDELAAAQQDAQNNRKGIWSACGGPHVPETPPTPIPSPTPTPSPTPVPIPTEAPLPLAPPSNCHPSYPDVCIPGPPPDLNCPDVIYSGFRVVGGDPHGFDRDRDGIGCE